MDYIRKDPPPDYSEATSVGRTRPALKITNHFKKNIVFCGGCEKIAEETQEQVEEYENDEFYYDLDLMEALDDLEREAEAALNPQDDTMSPENQNFVPMFDIQPSHHPEPLKPLEKFEFTKEDKEEFRQMFAEEAKVLMPHLRSKTQNVREMPLSELEPPKKKYHLERAATTLAIFDKTEAQRSVHPGNTEVERSAAIDIKTPTAPLVERENKRENMGVQMYVSLVLIFSVFGAAYIFSKGL